MRSGLRICVLALSLASGACDNPLPPAVAVREPSLDADDLAVVRGLLDGLGRPQFLVVDTTLAVCGQDRMALVERPGRCIGSFWSGFVSRVLPTARMLFESRNSRRLAVTGSLGPDVTFISATVTDFVESQELLRRHPPGSAIVSFSAPVYPGAGTAVLAYSVRDPRATIAAAKLQRQANGQWTLVPGGTAGAVEGQD